MKKIIFASSLFFIGFYLHGQKVYIAGSVYKIPNKRPPLQIYSPLRDPIIQGYKTAKNIYPNKLNRFASTVKISDPGIFFISYGEESKRYVLYPGDSIQIFFHHKNKPDTITSEQFVTNIVSETVKVSSPNLARVIFFDSLEKITGALEIGTFFNENDSKLAHDLFIKRIDYLNSYTTRNKLDSNFYMLVFPEIKGTYLNNLIVQGYSTSNFYDSSAYYQDLFTDDYNWNKVKESRAYITAISSFVHVFLRKNGWNSISIEEKVGEEFDNILNHLKDEQTRNYFLTDLLAQIIEKQPENFTEIFEKYKALCTDTSFVEGIKKKVDVFFAKYNNIQIPDEILNAHIFSLELNRQIKIKDILSSKKPVVLDFWASWCGPCLMEMDKGHEFEKQYQEKISFVYVSIDKNSDDWRKVIENENLYGHHYLLKGGFNTKFAEILKMKYVPRRIIIKQNRVTVFTGASPLNKGLYEQMLINSLK